MSKSSQLGASGSFTLWLGLSVLFLQLVTNRLHAEPIDFGLKCRLPGWPGHPAPTCDPGVPNQCCPGTKCLPDPFDSEHSICQQTDITPAEHALTADVLTSHVQALVDDALTKLKLATTSLYLSNRQEQRMSDTDIVRRAKLLTQNHPQNHPFNADKGERHKQDWHGGHDEQVQDEGSATGTPRPEKKGRLKTSKNVEDPDASTSAHQHKGTLPGGDFDYNKYYNGGGTGVDEGQSQGGYNYEKYQPPRHQPDDQKGKHDKDVSKSKEGKGGYEYSQYYESGGDPHKRGYQGSKSSPPSVSNTGSSPDGKSSGEGGFDYSQYYPMQQQAGKNGDTGKSSPSSKDGGSDQGAGGSNQGGFDYSQYYPGKQQSDPSSSTGGTAGGFDYSKYMPQSQQGQGSSTTTREGVRGSKNIAQSGESDDIIKKLALELLSADVELKTATAQAKKDVYEKIKQVLNELQSVVDKELGDDDGRDGSNLATQSPTLVWNDPNDFWSKYIPKMPGGGYGQGQNQGGDQSTSGGKQFNTGDRRPGTLGGPCGRTSYKDFGECIDGLVCEGLNQQRPGLCQMNRSTTLQISRDSAFQALQVADELSFSLRTAAMELLIGSSPRLDLEQSKMKEKQEAKDASLTLNDTTMDPREYSPATVGVVVLGFGVLGYFCWMNGGRRRSYQSIEKM